MFYTYIKPYCDIMSSSPGYLQDEYERARQYNYPADTFSAASPEQGGACLLRNSNAEFKRRMQRISGMHLESLLT